MSNFSRGISYFLFINGISFAAIFWLVFYTTVEYPGLVKYAKAHKLERYLKETYPEMPLIAFDVDNPLIIYLSILVALYLFGTEVMNVLLSWAVQRRLNRAKTSMSRETFKMQRNLTIMLLFQVSASLSPLF